MLGIFPFLPDSWSAYLATTPPEVLGAQMLLVVGWFPLFAIFIWGFSQIWLDYKQNQYEHATKFVLLEVKVPSTTIQTPKGMENFFSNLAGTKSAITWREHWLKGKEQAVFAFELVSFGGDAHFFIRCPIHARDIVEADLYAQYPDAEITLADDYAHHFPLEYPNEQQDCWGGELMLKKPEFLPIRTFDDFEHQGERDQRFKDPLLPLLEFMGKMMPGEMYGIQILIRAPEGDEYVKEGLEFLAKIMGREEGHKKKSSGLGDLISGVSTLPKEMLRQIAGLEFGGGHGHEEKKSDDFRSFKLTAAERIQIDAVAEKIAKVGWETKIRFIAFAPKGKLRKALIAAGTKGMMQPFASQLLNSFGLHSPSIPKDDYFWQLWEYAKKQRIIARRFAHRSFSAGATPRILNAEELATLFHFPGVDARTPSLANFGARRGEAPSALGYAPGDNEFFDWKKTHGADVPQTEEEITAALGEGPALPTPTLPHDPHPPENLPV